jgi:hypothetical protein
LHKTVKKHLYKSFSKKWRKSSVIIDKICGLFHQIKNIGRNWGRDNPEADMEDSFTDFDDLPYEEKLRIRQEEDKDDWSSLRWQD